MTLADFGVDPDDPDIDTRYEFQNQTGPWQLTEPDLDESVAPAKVLCPDCGYTIHSGDPVLLDYGRSDDLLLACHICEDCKNITPSHTASDADRREESGLSYPHTSLLLYDPNRVTDSEYPNWESYRLDLDGDLHGGERQ